MINKIFKVVKIGGFVSLPITIISFVLVCTMLYLHADTDPGSLLFRVAQVSLLTFIFSGSATIGAILTVIVVGIYDIVMGLLDWFISKKNPKNNG